MDLAALATLQVEVAQLKKQLHAQMKLTEVMCNNVVQLHALIQTAPYASATNATATSWHAAHGHATPRTPEQVPLPAGARAPQR